LVLKVNAWAEVAQIPVKARVEIKVVKNVFFMGTPVCEYPTGYFDPELVALFPCLSP
jgi:hypothetical protein